MFHLFWGLTIKIGFLLCKPQIIWGGLGYTNGIWDKPMLKSWVSRILLCCWSRDLAGFRTFVQLWQIVIPYSLKYHRLLFKTLWLGLLIVEYVHAAPVDMRKTFHIARIRGVFVWWIWLPAVLQWCPREQKESREGTRWWAIWLLANPSNSCSFNNNFSQEDASQHFSVLPQMCPCLRVLLERYGGYRQQRELGYVMWLLGPHRPIWPRKETCVALATCAVEQAAKDGEDDQYDHNVPRVFAWFLPSTVWFTLYSSLPVILWTAIYVYINWTII